MGHPSRTVTEQSFTVLNRACFIIFATVTVALGIPQGDIVLVPLGLRNRRILEVGDRVARRMRRGGLLSYPLVP